MAAPDRRQNLLQQMFAAHMAMAKSMMASRGDYAQVYGLNRAQAEALFVIKFRGGSTIGQLARILGITSGAATQTIVALEEQKLVLRRRLEEDRRVVQIDFTPAGEAMLEKLADYHFERLTQMLEDLTDEDLEELVRIENKIMSSLQKRETS